MTMLREPCTARAVMLIGRSGTSTKQDVIQASIRQYTQRADTFGHSIDSASLDGHRTAGH